MLKSVMLTVCALGFVSTTALAQGNAVPPPAGPTAVQCQQGYKDGQGWTKDQFTAACEKMRVDKKN